MPPPAPPIRATERQPAATDGVPSLTRESIGGGRYWFVRFLGEGATKHVFVARDANLQREVAVSVVPLAGLDDTEVARARREAEAMASLSSSRHVVTVYDIGEEDGELYTVSEYMPGGELTELLDQAEDRRLPVAEAVRIAGELAETLEDVHAAGIVHRDIKPQNVWLASDGTVKLGDFGLAVDSDRSRLTVDGLMVGTVAYMPPEQALGRSAEARSDIYSLGAVLYEMLCGTPPFGGDDASAVISQHLSTPPVGPRTRRAEVPAQLDRLVLEMLAKRADKRPQGSPEVKQALQAIGSALDERPASPAAAEGLEALTDLGFVGRESELAALRAAADAAISGRGSIVAVAGEPGIGKTRLVSEAAAYAELRGAKVVWGRCLDDPGAPAYWPWVQVIRSFVQEHDEDSLIADLGSGAADIASIVSEVRIRVPDLTEPLTLEPAQARFRLFDSISNFIVNAAGREPLAIVLDDLHVADKSSLLLLQFLAARLVDTRVLLLCTYRDDELEGNDELSEALGILSRERGYQRIGLSGLTEPEGRALLESISQQPVEGRDQLALLKAVHGESEGNPFFIGEIVRHLVDSGHMYRSDDGVWTSDVTTIRDLGIPKGIQDAIGRRLERLSEGCRGVLEVAAVLGREFGLQHLVMVTGGEREVVASRLDEAAGGDIVGAVEGDVDRFRFAHAAVRDTLYEGLASSRRVELHRRAGETLEELHADRIEPHLGELAHHFAEAAPAGEPEKAADYAWWAGERASAQHAYEDAALHFERALSLFASDPDEPVRRCELLLGLGDARWRSGDISGAKETFLRAAELAREKSLDEAFARAALGYGGGVGGFGVTDRIDDTLVDLLRGALRALPDRDSLMRVRAMGRLAVELALVDTAKDERVELAEGAVEMAERIGDPRVQLLALYSRQWSVLGPDDVEGQLTGADEILRLASAVGDREMEFRARHFRLSFLLQLGDVKSADREFKACAKLSDELRQPYYEWQVGIFRAMRALREGRFAEGERLAQSAFAIGQRSFPDLAMISFGAQLQQLKWATGGLDELLEGGEALAHQYPESAWPAALAFLYAEAGEEAKARSQMDKLAAEGFAIRRDRNWMTAMASLLVASEVLGDAERAATLYSLLEPFADQYTVVLTGAGLIGSNHLYLGLGARSAGRLDEAIGHFERAIERNRRIGERLMTPRVHLALAGALLERGGDGDLQLAKDQIETGLAMAQECGMQPHVEELMTLKLEVEGVGPIAVEASIDVVAKSIRTTRPDLGPAAAPDGTVTIMFSDIEDSTVLTDRLGDRRWMELLRAHNEIITRAVESHDGFNVKSQGDGFMLAFSSGRRAIHCAIDIQRALAELRESEPDSSVRVRIGLHAGEAIRDQDDFFGRNVILAARVASEAKGDEILVSSLLRELVSSSGDIDFGGSREVELKGLPGVHTICEVPWESAGRDSSAPREAV
jgi:class 3 adenylate cyclase/RecA/RadA recombinase